MNIGVDLRAMDGTSKFRGIGVYITRLVNGVLPMLQALDHQVTVYQHEHQQLSSKVEPGILEQCHITPVRKTLSNLGSTTRYRLSALLGIQEKRPSGFSGIDDLDIYWQLEPEYGLPRGFGGRTLCVAYDLIPLIMKDTYFQPPLKCTPKSLLTRIYKRRSLQTYRKTISNYQSADHIIAISQHTLEMMETHLGINPAKMTVIHPGPTPRLEGSGPRVAESPYIFFIGGLDARRDIDTLFDALRTVHSNSDITLYLAGKDFESDSRKTFIPSDLQDRVTSLGYVTDEEKANLYRHAICCVYPSRYEGFGLPILDAFVYDCPIITYENSSIPEVGGDAAIYVTDHASMAAEILKLQTHAVYRDERIEAGRQQRENFSWDRSVKQTASLLQSL